MYFVTWGLGSAPATPPAPTPLPPDAEIKAEVLSAMESTTGARTYFRVAVTATQGRRVLDATVFACAFGFYPGPTAPTSWIAGHWDAQSEAYVLLGPGGDASLTPGTYYVYLRIQNTPEVTDILLPGIFVVR